MELSSLIRKSTCLSVINIVVVILNLRRKEHDHYYHNNRFQICWRPWWWQATLRLRRCLYNDSGRTMRWWKSRRVCRHIDPVILAYFKASIACLLPFSAATFFDLWLKPYQSMWWLVCGFPMLLRKLPLVVRSAI